MPPRSRKAAAPARPAPEARPVAQRGLTWQAEKLTGKRGQRGFWLVPCCDFHSVRLSHCSYFLTYPLTF